MVNRQSMQVNVYYGRSLLSVGGQADKAKQKHRYSHSVPWARRVERLQWVTSGHSTSDSPGGWFRPEADLCWPTKGLETGKPPTQEISARPTACRERYLRRVEKTCMRGLQPSSSRAC